MTKLTETIRIKYWQLLALLAMTGCAWGNILSKSAGALGV